MGKKNKKIDYRHFICIVILLGFVLCTIFLFPHSLGRCIEAVRDLLLSLAYYFMNLLGLKDKISPTINTLPKYPFFSFIEKETPDSFLPNTFTGFSEKWQQYWQLFVSGKNLESYLKFLLSKTNVLINFLLIVMPLILALRFMLLKYMTNVNNDYDKDSKALRCYKKLISVLVIPIASWCVDFVSFAREQRVYIKIWKWICAFSFNLLAIVISFFAYYLYFIVNFDISTIYIQIYKLFLDLSVPIRFIPVWIWLVIGIYKFYQFRIKIALMRLNHMERRNRGFINARSIAIFICGTMGKSKTTMVTDIALSQEVMFRNKAYELMLENDMKFPLFPWIVLENEIKERMSWKIGRKGRIFSFATCEAYVDEKLKEWLVEPLKQNIYGYDFERNGLLYNDRLKKISIWEAIRNYAKLYFIYRSESPLLYSNYSIRTDKIFLDNGNMPQWNTDFFSRDSRVIEAFSRYAHILDFDMLRLGRKMEAENPKKDVLEFGVIGITEIGKERGCHDDNKKKDRNSSEANQKNDLLVAWLKMCRHPSVVDNYVFCKVITDEQRPTSLDPDIRNLTELIHIRESSEMRLALPFFTFGELLHSIVFGRFVDTYTQYRFNRADNTLLMYLVKRICSKLHNYYTQTYNRFGYKLMNVDVEAGSLEGKYSPAKYYLMSKKIYSKRFATDCYAEFFKNKALRSELGINDVPEYVSEKATLEEMQSQNSYFVGDISMFD